MAVLLPQAAPAGDAPPDAEAAHLLARLLAVAARQFDARTLLFEPVVRRAADGSLLLGGAFAGRRLAEAARDALEAPATLAPDLIAGEPARDATLLRLREGAPLRRAPDPSSERVTTATGAPSGLAGSGAVALQPEAAPGWHLVQLLGDGYLGFVAAADVAPLERADYLARLWARRDRGREERVVGAARAWLGTPYLWGGAEPGVGIDCSALAQWSVGAATGLALPRDANQQVRLGGPAGVLADRADLLPGDLLFFVRAPLRVYHVALSLGGARFLHADGARGVVEASLDPAAADHDGRHAPDFLAARRLWA